MSGVSLLITFYRLNSILFSLRVFRFFSLHVSELLSRCLCDKLLQETVTVTNTDLKPDCLG